MLFYSHLLFYRVNFKHILRVLPLYRFPEKNKVEGLFGSIIAIGDLLFRDQTCRDPKVS